MPPRYAYAAGMDAGRGLSGREQLLDTAFGLAVTAVAVASVVTDDPAVAYEFRDPGAVSVLLAVAAGLPLVVRRRWPLAVSLTITAAVTALGALSYRVGEAAFCLMLGLYAVAAHRDRRPASVALAAAYTGFGLLVLLRVRYFEHPLAVFDFLAVTTAWTMGRFARRRRADRDAARARALAAERSRAVAVERAVFADRLRIARELHDVVSHTLTVIAVQAGSARYLLGAGDGPLSTIERASRAALDDLRRMLGLLRADAAVADPVPPPPDPARKQVDDRVVDAALSVALAILGLTNVFVVDPSVAHDYADPSVGVVGLVLLGCLSLALRRTAPVSVFAVSAGAALLLTLIDARTDIPGLAMFVALYTVAAWRRFAVSATCLGVIAAVDLLTVLIDLPGTGSGLQDLTAPAALVPWGLGLIVRRWRRDRDAAAARATEALRRAAVEAERAVLAERLRLAAELQDVVAHTLSGIAVQSAVARHQAGDADPAAPALAAIEQASRSALDDLRRMLGVLHADAPLSPSPSVDELPLLTSAHRAAHGPVSLTVDDAVRGTPASVQITAYRLVQEALTNIRKHAPRATTTVALELAGDQVVVRVDNDGPRATEPPRAGFGLTGMRERVALFDGRLEAGPLPGGGFRVEAALPLNTDHKVAT